MSAQVTANFAGLCLFVVALFLVAVTNVLPYFSVLDYGAVRHFVYEKVYKHRGMDESTFGNQDLEIFFGIWRMCVEVRVTGHETCYYYQEHFGDEFFKDWLQVMQILMGIGASFGILTTLGSIGQLYSGNRKGHHTHWGRINCVLGVLGGVFILAADITYAIEYQSLSDPLIDRTHPEESEAVRNGSTIEDNFDLGWGFATNVAACVLILASAVLHLPGQCSSLSGVLRHVMPRRGGMTTAMANTGGPMGVKEDDCPNHSSNRGLATSPPSLSSQEITKF